MYELAVSSDGMTEAKPRLETFCVLHLRDYLVALPTNPAECSHRGLSRNGREGCSGMLHDVIMQMVYSVRTDQPASTLSDTMRTPLLTGGAVVRTPASENEKKMSVDNYKAAAQRTGSGSCYLNNQA